MENAMHKWSDKEVEQLVRLRAAKAALFSGRRHASQYGWEVVLKEMGLEGVVDPARAGKKWENLKKTYKELKKPPTGVSTESGESTAATWKWYPLMDEVLGGKPSIVPPVLITSAGGDHYSTAAVLSPETGGEEEQEVEEVETVGQRGAVKRKSDPVLDYLERESKKREDRERRDDEREDRMLALLEIIAKKM